MYILFFSMIFLACSSPQKILTGGNTNNNSYSPTETEMVDGLKEALNRGVTKGTELVSQPDGYFKNEAIKILFPEELKSAENKLRSIGLGSLADNIVLTFNRAAEAAAEEAKPIFINAIKQMTFQDAAKILLGSDDAATDYLRRTTSDELYRKFKPVIENKLDQTGATKFWSEAAAKYNKIPFISDKLPTDISDYVTKEAMEGIFFMIEKEEAKIRQDPLARTNQILKKVFSYADSQK